MNQLRSLFGVFVILMASGCAWQRIPAAPEYTVDAPIPLKVGAVLADSRASTYYGPAVLRDWKEMRLFESLVYPYLEGNSVDVVMKLSINGGWNRSGAAAAVAGFVTGFTLGLAGTAVGLNMTGTHDAEAILSSATSEVGRYSVQVTSTVEWGITANTSEVSEKAEEMQGRRIAYELAKKIRADRQTLISQMGR